MFLYPTLFKDLFDMKELILATSNPGKIKELSSILAPIVCIPQTVFNIVDAEETGLSFIENAIIKARHASEMAQKPALADDSGLVVPALNGAPGIFSARFSGEKATDERNINLLLQKMANIPKEQRQAYFYCAIALVQHSKDPTPLIATGELHGYITHAPSGNKGFGYDPVFYLTQHQCTSAQLPEALKNTISHRAKALQQLQTQISIHHES